MYNDSSITPKQLKPLKIICFAIPFFGTVFCIIALFIGGNGSEAGSSDTLNTLRIVHLILTLTSLFSSKFIADKVISGSLEVEVRDTVQTTFLQKYQAYTIIQLAVIEGAVLFGGVILIQTPQSVLQSDPTYYLHLLPLALLWMRSIQLSPTIDKIEQLSRQYQQ
ncbi:MAG TPA: hypothetical protein VIX80_09955 [Candidatus Kapabacteria bacterium]